MRLPARYKVLKCIVMHLLAMLITLLATGLLFPALVIVATEAASLNNLRRYFLASLLVHLPPEPHYRRCGTHISESKVADVERTFQAMRLGPGTTTEHSHVIYTDLLFHVVYENTTLEGGYIPQVNFIKCPLLEAEECAGNNKLRIKSTF